MTDRSYIEQNDASRARLDATLERLTDADLTRELEGGWTVASALGHIAFWEEYDLTIFRRSLTEAKAPAYGDYEALNEAMRPLWLLLPPHAAVQYLREMLRAVDGALAGLDDGVVETLLAGRGAISLERSEHRDEHLEQIQRALAQPVA
jgi:hypothetical protein